jgi:hypothetical protein
MTGGPPSPTAGTEDLKKIVGVGVKDAADGVLDAIDGGRKPGRPLDIVAKVTSEAP